MENNEGGIFSKMQESNSKPVVIEDLVDALMNVFKNVPTPDYKLKVGSNGAEYLWRLQQSEIEEKFKNDLILKMETAVAIGKLDNDRFKKMKTLLLSNDKENVDLAKKLIFNL